MTSCISARSAGHSGFNNTGKSTPQKTAYEEFGHRYVRVLPLSLQQVALIRTTLESVGKLSHNQFV